MEDRGRRVEPSLIGAIGLLCALWVAAALDPGRAWAATKHLVYFQDTEYELDIYDIVGPQKGNTLLIIGGIHNEPGSYLAADLYADMALQRGRLIVVPRANFFSIHNDQRGPHGDMNRKFTADPEPAAGGSYDDQIISVLKDLIAQSDLVLNLHDGSGFYSDRPKGPLRNPLRWGQSIIADRESYDSPKYKRSLPLGQVARKIAEEVNLQIDDPDHHFHFNNTRTADPDSPHPEQRHSATFYALTRVGVPAFGVETSKEIDSSELRVRFQTLVVNAFMREFDIIPEHPKIYLDPPTLKYLVIAVNDSPPVVVPNEGKLFVAPGEKIYISHVEANYSRGITADIAGVGNSHDVRRSFPITRPTSITVKKDKYRCGQVQVLLKSPDSSGPLEARSANPAEARSALPRLSYFILEIHGIRRAVTDQEELEVVKGEKLRVVDALLEQGGRDGIKVNVVGFVGDKRRSNQGEDRGYLIDTATDLMPRYSVDKKGNRYAVEARIRDHLCGRMFLRLSEAGK